MDSPAPQEKDGLLVEVVRRRVRRISIRVLPDGHVRLTIPLYHATLAEGQAFLNAHMDWINKVRTRLALSLIHI